MKIRSEWDLNPIYPGLESSEFVSDLATSEEKPKPLRRTWAGRGVSSKRASTAMRRSSTGISTLRIRLGGVDPQHRK